MDAEHLSFPDDSFDVGGRAIRGHDRAESGSDARRIRPGAQAGRRDHSGQPRRRRSGFAALARACVRCRRRASSAGGPSFPSNVMRNGRHGPTAIRLVERRADAAARAFFASSASPRKVDAEIVRAHFALETYRPRARHPDPTAFRRGNDLFRRRLVACHQGIHRIAISRPMTSRRGRQMDGFLAALRTQRWDDHRYYHHSRINQSLHFVSAISFLFSYLMIFKDPAISALAGWLVAMTTRQCGHFFFEPKRLRRGQSGQPRIQGRDQGRL